MDDFENKLVGALSDVASRTDVGHAPLAEIKTPAPRRGWVKPLVAAAAVLAVVGAGFAVAPLVGGDDDADADLVVAAPGKRLAGMGSVLVEVPGGWGTRAVSGASRHEGCNAHHPQESVVEYQGNAAPWIPTSTKDGPSDGRIICFAIALPGDRRPDDVEVIQFASSAPKDGSGKARTGFVPGELAGVPADILPAVCDQRDLDDSVYCTASARFPAATGGQDVWVITEAWTAERATEMLSWVRIASDQVGVPAPLEMSLEEYLSVLDELGLDVKVAEHPLSQSLSPYFEPTPEPTSVLREGDVVRVDLHGIDVPDSVDPNDVVVDDSTRQIGMGDLMMDVPAAWKADQFHCDVPIASTWLVGLPESRGCFAAVQRPDDVEVVRWSMGKRVIELPRANGREEEFLGVETTRWATQCAPRGRDAAEICSAQVWLKGDPTKAYITVEAATAERADELIATLRRDSSQVAMPPLPDAFAYGAADPDQVDDYLALLETLGVRAIASSGEEGWEDAENVGATVSFTSDGEDVPVGLALERGKVAATIEVTITD